MMSRIDRIRNTVSARKAARAHAERSDQAFEPPTRNLPVPAGPVVAARGLGDERRQADAEVAAQMLGQDGQRRGLRGGTPVLQAAQSAYNRTEWSGSYDRRARQGRQTRTDI